MSSTILMIKKISQKGMVSKVATKRVLDQNAAAFKVYDTYKKTADIIERAEFASGKRVSYKTDMRSTLDFKINLYCGKHIFC